MAEAIYTTRRTMLIEERNRLSQAIADAFGALTALMNGKITSYSLGTWTISRAQADIDKLKQWLKDARLRLAEIDNIRASFSFLAVNSDIFNLLPSYDIRNFFKMVLFLVKKFETNI